MKNDKNTPDVQTQESYTTINDKQFKVINHFEGKETASKLLYDMAVKRVLNESPTVLPSDGEEP